MKDNLNCPNCGAPITGYKCEYCGTVFYDFADMETGKIAYLRLKNNNKIVVVKALITRIAFDYDNINTFYSDDTIYFQQGNLELKIDADPLPDEDGIVYKMYDLEHLEQRR